VAAPINLHRPGWPSGFDAERFSAAAAAFAGLWPTRGARAADGRGDATFAAVGWKAGIFCTDLPFVAEIGRAAEAEAMAIAVALRAQTAADCAVAAGRQGAMIDAAADATANAGACPCRTHPARATHFSSLQASVVVGVGSRSHVPAATGSAGGQRTVIDGARLLGSGHGTIILNVTRIRGKAALDEGDPSSSFFFCRKGAVGRMRRIGKRPNAQKAERAKGR